MNPWLMVENLRKMVILEQTDVRAEPFSDGCVRWCSDDERVDDRFLTLH